MRMLDFGTLANLGNRRYLGGCSGEETFRRIGQIFRQDMAFDNLKPHGFEQLDHRLARDPVEEAIRIRGMIKRIVPPGVS